MIKEQVLGRCTLSVEKRIPLPSLFTHELLCFHRCLCNVSQEKLPIKPDDVLRTQNAGHTPIAVEARVEDPRVPPEGLAVAKECGRR